MSAINDLVDAFTELEAEKTYSLVKKLLEEGQEPAGILEACRKATAAIGSRFEKGEYFLSELVYAGEIFNEVMKIVLPLVKGEVKPAGTILLGTVQGDAHDIGKNIFKAFAEAAGFKVIDLGVDVSPEKFAEAVKTYNPEIVGLSGLLTLAIESMKKTVDALKSAGLREKVKIIIGGGRTDEYVKEYVKADAWADDATRGVRLCNDLLGRA